jgi:hypothetical protein
MLHCRGRPSGTIQVNGLVHAGANGGIFGGGSTEGGLDVELGVVEPPAPASIVVSIRPGTR